MPRRVMVWSRSPAQLPRWFRAVWKGSPETWNGRGVLVLIVLVLVLQRFVIPAGGSPAPLVVPVGYAGAAVLALTGRLTVDRLRLELFAIAAVLCAATTFITAVRGGSPSVTSLGLLLVLYLLWTLRAVPGTATAFRQVARGFVSAMVVLASVGVAQLALQLAGVWRYRDYLADVVPSSWLSQAFNTNIPAYFGSPVYKANAFVFLEPSYLSQFAALAVIAAIVIRAPVWQVLVLLSGLFSAISGTGIILLAAGLLLLLVRAPSAFGPRHLVALAAVGGAALLTPVGSLLLDRVGEPTETGSSGYLRFVQPYTEVAQGLESDPVRYVVGAGAGAVERLLTSSRGGYLGQAVVYPIVPKLVFEYGLVAGGVFALFIVLALVDRAPWRVVPGSLVVMLFFLSGSLLQAHTVFIAWLLTSFWTEQRTATTPLPREGPAPWTAVVTDRRRGRPDADVPDGQT